MKEDSYDLNRATKAIKMNPDLEIIIIANKKATAELYWEYISEHLNTSKKPHIITNYKYSLDGIPVNNSLVLLVNRWWENRNAIEFIKKLVSSVRLTLPVTIPL